MPNKKRTIEQIVQEVQAPQPLPSVYLPKAEPAGRGGRITREDIQRVQNKTTFKDVVSNPLLYASKAQEAILDPIADTAWRITHPTAARQRDEERQKANEAMRESSRPSAWKAAQGMVVKGADQAVTGITSTADWLLGNAMKELGWQNNPISKMNEAAQANAAANRAYYEKNMANATKAQRTVEELGTSAVAAVPDLVIAYLTAGGNLAAQGSGVLARGGARLAGAEAAAQTQSTLRRVASGLYKNPQYWTSFSRVAGPSYEQAKEDGASDWEANMYALTNGLMNAAVEVGGGIETLPKEMRTGRKAIWDWIKSSADEGKEEVVQGVIERALQNLTYGKGNALASVEDENAVFNPITSLKEFGGGFAVGGLLGSGPMISNVRAGSAEPAGANRADPNRQQATPAAPVMPTNPLQTAAQQSAVEVLREVTAGNTVTEEGAQSVLKEKDLARRWMQAMGQETSENISDADLETALRNTVARLTGQIEITMNAETKARYDAAKTETAKTGILYGVSDADIQSAERLGQATGRRVVFFSEEGQRDGYYDKRTGVLHVNARSENPVAQIIAHELTHSTEMAEDYNKLAQHIMRKLAKAGNLEALQAQIREVYESHQVDLSSEDLDHEVVAYFVEHNLLTDEESILSLVQEDRTLGQRILAMLDRILAKLGNQSAGERTFIREARDLYARALEGSGVTSAQQIQDLNDQLRRGEITEEEYDAAFDRAYNAEDALRADVQNSFAGPNAKTADLEQLRAAKEMLAEDVDPETIRQQTGWFQGADGKWRFEIDDSSMKYYANGDARGKIAIRSSWFAIADREKALRKELKSEDQKRLLYEFQEIVRNAESEDAALEDERLGEIWEQLSNDVGQKFDQWAIDYIRFIKSPFSDGDLLRNTLADYISHDQLFEAYPELRDTSLVFEEMPREQKGRYSKAEDTIYLNSELRNAPEKTLIHEIQHILQGVEGFSNGSSPAAWNRRIEQGYDNRTESAKAEQRRLQEQMNQLREDDPEFFDEFAELYHSSPSVPRGEVNFDTLEQITEDPPEWQAWDAQRDAMEEKYGNRIWDAFRLFDAFRQAEMNPQRRDANELYRNTAGEIEARDAANRMNMTAEERKNTPPDTGDENTVFADYDAVQYFAADSATENEEVLHLKDQARKHLDELNAMAPVANVKSPTTFPSRVSERRKWVMSIITSTEAVRQDVGVIRVDSKQIGTALSYIKDPSGLAAFTTLMRVLNRGKLIETHHDHKNNGIVTYTFGAPVTINGTTGIMVATVKRTKGNNYRAHAILMPDGSAFILPDESKNEADPHSVLAQSVTERLDEPTVSASNDNVSESEPSVNTNPLPKANSPTLQNSFSRKKKLDPNRFNDGALPGVRSDWSPAVPSDWQTPAETISEQGVQLPKAEAQAQTVQQAPEGVQLPKAEPQTQEERLPKKAQTYLQRARSRAVKKIAEVLSIPVSSQREFLQGAAKEVSEEYLRTGKISEETRERLFQQAYDEGRVVLDDYYNDHKHIRDEIRRVGLNIDDVKGDIADLGAFRRQHMGTVRLVKNGMGIDQFYQDILHDMAPGLFPLDISNRTDQLMRIIEVAQSIQKTENSLDEFYGADAEEFRSWARNDFEEAMDELTGELRRAKRYADDKAELEPEEPVTAENVTQAYKDLKEQRRTYEKAAARNLLTDADEIAVGRILRGEDTVDGLDPRRYNVKGIRAVVEAKRDYEQTARKIRKYKQDLKKARRDTADSYLGSVMAWKDKKTGAQYSRETMERNIRDIVANKADAQRVIAEYFTPVHTHEAAATRMKNDFRERVKGMNLSRKIEKGNTVSEAHAVQLLGEAMDNLRYLEQHKRVENRDGKTYEEWQAVIRALWESSPNLNRQKIEGAVEQFRSIYDELFQQMNTVRIRNGYEPINYRQGYFPHFQPGDSSGLLEEFSRALGISADVTSLPTTINGLTHQFRPGIRWFGNAQERIGFNTTYDAVEGFDKYIEGAADVIHHTDDIQALRALSDQIRYRSSDKGIQEEADRIRRMDNLTDDEKQTLLDETYKKARTHLGNFVVELEEYTNLLANKRSRADRDMEQRLGRNMYNLAKRFESRVAANMVAVNPGSWITNLIPLTQGWTTTNTRYMVQGMWESLRALKTSDGMLEKSDFLTNRKGADPLVKMWEQSSKAPTAWQKVSAFGGRAGEILSSPMEYIDQFTAGALVRARYHQNVSRGMSEDAAIHEADAWTSGIMADRSKGSTPTVFNQQNPLKKVFTQFQLEVNNELSWLAKDVPDELKEKTLGAAALAIFKFLVGTYLFNDLYEALVGRRAAFDPLGILNDTVGDITGYQLPNLIDLATGRDDFETEKKDAYDTAGDVGGQIAENLPFIGGVLGGGRVPISSALPDVDNLTKAIGKSGLSGKKRAQLIGKELGNSASYVVLPFGGSQLRKVVQGVSAVAKGGSYSMDNDGNELLQYPVYNDSTGAVVGNTARAVLFGKSSLPGAREWVESGFDSFSKKETAAYKELAGSGAKQQDAYEIMKQLHDVSGDKVKDQKSEIIRNSSLTDDQKQALYKSLLMDKDSKNDEKFTAMRRVGMSWDQVMDTYDEYRKIDAAEGKANARATEFAVWCDENLSPKQAEVVKDKFKIWAMMPASTDRYEGFKGQGLSSKEAKRLTDALSSIVPPAGKDQATYLQKYQAIVGSGVSEAAQVAAMKATIPDSIMPKYEQTLKYEVSAKDYVAMYAKTEELKEKYQKSSVNQDIAKEAIASIPNLTLKQKAVLWQIQNKSWKGSKNPYDTTVGWAVYKALNNIDSSAVMLP